MPLIHLLVKWQKKKTLIEFQQQKQRLYCAFFKTFFYNYLQKIKDEFHERDIGDCPDTDCPEQLTSEIGRRLKRRFQSSQTSIQIPCTMYGNSSTNSETTASDVNHTDAPRL